MGSNAGLHTASMLNLHMNMSMAMDCLLLASWLGAFSVVVYTTMVRCILQSVTWRHDSKIATHGPRETKWPISTT